VIRRILVLLTLLAVLSPGVAFAAFSEITSGTMSVDPSATIIALREEEQFPLKPDRIVNLSAYMWRGNGYGKMSILTGSPPVWEGNVTNIWNEHGLMDDFSYSLPTRIDGSSEGVSVILTSTYERRAGGSLIGLDDQTYGVGAPYSGSAVPAFPRSTKFWVDGLSHDYGQVWALGFPL